jgi:hypothetical protein
MEEMFKGDPADTRTGKFPFVLMGGRADTSSVCRRGARTRIGASGNFLLESFAFQNRSCTSFCHNCEIPKPQLLHPKTRTIQIVNISGFGMQQLGFWDVTAVTKRCALCSFDSGKPKTQVKQAGTCIGCEETEDY